VSILPKSPLGETVGYALNRWDALQNYLYDPKLLIDNNPIENAIRPLALCLLCEIQEAWKKFKE